MELDFATQRNMYSHLEKVFLPLCDERGNYLPLQTQGTDGNKWCVDISTGSEIVGTRVRVNGPDPECPDGTLTSLYGTMFQ